MKYNILNALKILFFEIFSLHSGNYSTNVYFRENKNFAHSLDCHMLCVSFP